MEEWREIPIAPGYAVSNLGRIMRTIPGRRTKPGLIRRPWFTKSGYAMVSLRVNGVPKGFKISRLVLLAFIGPSEKQVNHINGQRADDRLENLEYVTGSENQCHSRDVLGTFPQGVKHWNAKLDDDKVRRIFALRKAGMTGKQIGAAFGISDSQVFLILHRKWWKHVHLD